MINGKLRFLREQDNPDIWYVIFIDHHGGCDFYGTIEKKGNGMWYFLYPEVPLEPLDMQSDYLIQISEFVQSLKRYGSNGQFEYPTEHGYEKGSLQDDWTSEYKD